MGGCRSRASELIEDVFHGQSHSCNSSRRFVFFSLVFSPTVSVHDFDNYNIRGGEMYVGKHDVIVHMMGAILRKRSPLPYLLFLP